MGKWIDCNRREREREKEERGEVGKKSDAIDTLKLQREERKVRSIFPPLQVLLEDIHYNDSTVTTLTT